MTFHPEARGGGYFLVMDYWGCAAARWTGSHFHGSTDYNGVAFLSIFNKVPRMESHFFGTLRERKLFAQK